MEENSLDNLKEKRFRIKDAMRRGISLLLALIMMFPAGAFAAEDDVIWNEYKKSLKTHMLNQNDKEYVIDYKGSQADSSYFAETKAKELFNEVMEEMPVKNGELNIQRKLILPLWEGTTLKSIRHRVTYYNSKAELDKADDMLEDAFLDIVSEKDTDKDRVNAAIKYVLDVDKSGVAGVDNDINEIYKEDGSRNDKVSKRVYGIIFSMLMDKLGYRNSVNTDFTNKVTILGKEYTINATNGVTDPSDLSDTPTKAQIEYEITLAVKEIKASKSIDELKELAKGVITSNKLKEIRDKIAEIEKEISRYDDKKKVLLNTATKANIVVSFVELDEVINVFKYELDKQKESIATEAVVNAEENKTAANVAIAKDAVDNFITDDLIKNTLKDRIEKIEKIIEKITIATDAIKKAETTKKEDDIKAVDDIIKELEALQDPAQELKDLLADLIERVQAIRESDAKKAVTEATKAVEAAESGVTRYLNGQIDSEAMQKLIDDAAEKIDKVAVDIGEVKTKADLTKRFDEVDDKKTAIKNVNDTVATMEASLDEDNIDKILSIIDKDDDGYTNTTTKNYYKGVEGGKKDNTIGTALNTRIVEIQKVIGAIESVAGMKRQADIKTARAAVKKIGAKFEKIKNALNGAIDVMEEDIIENEPDVLIKIAEDAIQEAYNLIVVSDPSDPIDDSKYSSAKVIAAVKTAKTAIGKVKDPLEKIKLNRAIEGVESAQKARDAVALVKVTELRKDYTNADKLVTAITDREEFDGYIKVVVGGVGSNGNFIAIKDALIKELGKVLPKIEIEEAKVAVTKAENSLNQKDYDLAFTAIGKVEGDIANPNTPKGNLKQRLDIVKSVIDATNALAKAVSSVGEAAKSSKELDNSKKIETANAAIEDAEDAIKAISSIYIDDKYKINRETMTATVKDLKDIYILAIEDVKSLSDVQQKSDTKDVDYKNALTKAKTAVGNVTDSKVRLDLEAGITAIEARQNAVGSVKKAEKELVEAEMMLNGLLLETGHKTYSEYNPVKDRTNFADTIKEVEKAIAEADAEIKVLKDKRSTEFKNRLLAVITAKDVAVLIAKTERDDPSKEPLVKAEVDAATKALPKIIEDIIKDDKTPANIIINHKAIKEYFTSRVKWLNSELVKALQFAEAKKLTDKASQTLADGDIIKAIDYVSKMQNETDRNDFNIGNTGRKINGIKNIVDKLAGTVRDKINGAIPLVAVNDKTAAKAVTDAKKSFESFKKIVGEANKKLVGIQENPIVAYKEIYEKPQAGDPKVGGHIPHYNISLGVLDKSLNIWKLMIAAEKSKKKEDVEAIRKIHLVGMTLEDTVDENGKKTEGIKTLIGSVDPAAMTVHVDLYKSIADGLENKQKELEGYQKGEEGRQEEAQIAINDAKDVLYNYATDKSVGEDVYEIEARKDKVRIDLTIKISSARMAIESIKDAPVKKAKLAELGKIEVYRDAIAAVGNALAYPTQATYKAAESAVKKCSYDYGLVLAELQSELRVINDILDSYAKAEKATKLVEIAEETKLQSDVDKARMAVDMLDDSNPAKIPLGKRLDNVQKFIDTKDDVDRDATNVARALLEKALINITQASRYFDLTTLTDEQILEAYALLRGRDGVDEEGKPIIEAGARHFIRDAKSEINKISDILLKETLNKLIIQREEELESALHEIHIKASERLLGIANEATNKRLALAADRGDMTEKEWTEERLRLEREARKAIEEARNTIDGMSLPGFMTQKDNLMKWLNQIIGDLANENAEDRYIRAEKMIKEASDAVEKAARSREEADKDKFNLDLKAAKDAIFFAQQAIHAIPAGYNQDKVEGLQKVLDGLQMLWQNISDGVSDEKTIAEAKELIEIVKQKLKAWKAGDETEKNVEIAFTIARNKVMGIIDNAKRTELNLELDALEEEFRADGGQVIIPDDGRNKQSDFDRAKAAVLKAVESRLQKDVDAARKLVAKLVDGPSKDAMNRILDGIIIEQTEEEKRKEEEAKRKEEEAKKKAEEARKKKYPGIDDALNSKDRDKNNPDAKWGKENEFKKK